MVVKPTTGSSLTETTKGPQYSKLPTRGARRVGRAGARR